MTNFDVLMEEIQNKFTPEILADLRYENIGFSCDNCEMGEACFEDEEFHCKEMFLRWLNKEINTIV